jgi:heme exporter protein C
MPAVFLTPLLLMGLAYTFAFLALWVLRTRAEVWRRRATTLAVQAAWA